MAKKNKKEKKNHSIPTPLPKKSTPFWQFKLMSIALMVLAIILFLGLFNLAGVVGNSFALVIQKIFGWFSWGVFLILVIGARLLFEPEKFEKMGLVVLGLFLILFGASAAFHLFFINNPLALSQNKGGGYIGYGLSWPIFQIFGLWASLIIFLGVIAGGFVLIFANRKKEEEEEEIVEETKKITLKKEPAKLKILPLKIKKEKPEQETKTPSFPEIEVLKQTKSTPSTFPLDLLDNLKSEAIGGNIEENKEVIKKTLENFGIPVEMGGAQVGPTVTQYTLRPQEGIKLSRITALSNDLALSLAKHPIRIEAPIPGKSLVGIEVPNQSVAVVHLKEILSSREFKQKSSNLIIALGKDVSGNIYFDELSRMPHILICGATGSGKTVFLNSLILTLLYQNSTQTLRFILIDPKRVELTLYQNLPHLLTPTLTQVDKTINVLKWLIREMERRFDIMEEAKKRNIEDYNKDNTREKLPYIVVVIDELADLMVAAARDVETCIVRLTQMARATGIHLVLATQRPSVDIITGLIKANITTRVAFSVASMADSRTVLDFSGAEKLIGKGDMLYVSPKLSRPKRLQSPYVSDEEIKRVVKYLSQSGEENNYIDIEGQVEQIKGEESDLEEDELLARAREEVISAHRASATLLQRRLRIGYARAARLLDLLEDEGTIGPADGSRPRQILKP